MNNKLLGRLTGRVEMEKTVFDATTQQWVLAGEKIMVCLNDIQGEDVVAVEGVAQIPQIIQRSLR